MWQRITAEYRIDNAAKAETLTIACEAIDRAETCRAQIDGDGVLFRDRDHPLIRHEMAARALVIRTLQRMGFET